MAEFPKLPIELCAHIITYMDSLSDMKNVSLTSKLFNSIVSRKMWKMTRLRKAKGLRVIKHLPIEVLDISNLYCEDSHMKLVGQMSGLIFGVIGHQRLFQSYISRSI